MKYLNGRLAITWLIIFVPSLNHYANKKNSCRQYFPAFDDHVRGNF